LRGIPHFLAQSNDLHATRAHLPPDDAPAVWFTPVVEMLGRHGLIGQALFTGLEQERPHRVVEIREVSDLWLQIGTGGTDKQSFSQRARDLAIDIIGHSYRRALRMNIEGRFADPDELGRVASSIAECRGAIQARVIAFHAEADKPLAALLLEMLSHLDAMDDVFRAMQRAVPDLGTGSTPRVRRSCATWRGGSNDTGTTTSRPSHDLLPPRMYRCRTSRQNHGSSRCSST